jgi:HlyD family secretion protein
MNKIRILLLIIIVAVGIGGAVKYGSDRKASNPGEIRVSGNIEVTQVDLSFRIPGWVSKRLVDEGEIVTAGQTIATLDPTELNQEVDRLTAAAETAQSVLAELQAGSRPEEIAQAQAALQRAKSRLDELVAGSRPQEIAAAQAAVDRAKAEVVFAEANLKRMKDTLQSGAVAQDQYENSRMAFAVAEGKLQEAEERLKLANEGSRKEQIAQGKAAVEEAEAMATLVKNGPRKETIDQARSTLRQSQQALAIARTRLSYATLVSSVAGVVLSKNVESGEFVAAGTPIVTVGNLKDIWLRAYIVETDLQRVKVGQLASVFIDSSPDKPFKGRVSFIASEAEFTPKTVQTSKERIKLVYRIKIDIDNPDMELKPGMPADALIEIGK